MKIDPNKLRLHVLDMVYKSQSGHIGGSFSLAELIASLYTEFPGLIEDNQDILILSKGHAVPILYAVFYELGLIDSIDSFREINSNLQGHPVHKGLKYLHATTGSLGQGLSIAIGHALAYRLEGKHHKVFCIIGDGEIQEGQVWEAFMMAAKYKLDNLICILDNNGSQSDGKVEDIMPLRDINQKLDSFGWHVYDLDGDNPNMNGWFHGPTFINLHTKKASGVSFMEENGMVWHAKAPNSEEYNRALNELLKKIDESN